MKKIIIIVIKKVILSLNAAHKYRYKFQCRHTRKRLFAYCAVLHFILRFASGYGKR